MMLAQLNVRGAWKSHIENALKSPQDSPGRKRGFARWRTGEVSQ
jgi:hypothetical protein